MKNRENTFKVDGDAHQSKIEKFGMNPNSMDTNKDLILRAIALNLPANATLEEIIAAEKKQGRFATTEEESDEDLKLAV